MINAALRSPFFSLLLSLFTFFFSLFFLTLSLSLSYDTTHVIRIRRKAANQCRILSFLGRKLLLSLLPPQFTFGTSLERVIERQRERRKRENDNVSLLALRYRAGTAVHASRVQYSLVSIET
jgi:hypothetical protein